MDETDLNAGKVEPEAGTVYGRSRSQQGGPIRQLMLAGLGAAALACDAADDAFTRMVERGESVQSQMQNMTDDVLEQGSINRSRASSSFRSAVDSFLNALNLPSKTDLDTLDVKLNILTRKIDDLELERAQAAAKTAPPATAEDSAT
jgi:polyhydroxyalkanoate synthesis regulator phasin